MKDSRVLRATLIVWVTLATLIGGCSEQGEAKIGMDQPPAVVQTTSVEQGSFDVEVQFVGTLNARNTADLYARVSGPVVSVEASTGDSIRKGQLLAQIDPSGAEKQVEQSQAALRMAGATLQQRKANLEVSAANARRTENLSSQNLVSESDLDMARAELTTSEAQLELANAQIEQADANLNSAKLELDRTRIVAPFDGFVARRHLDLGDYATTNRPVFTVVDLGVIRTTIAITGRDASRIHLGQTAVVTSEVVPGKRFEGEVARIASVFDPQTNTVEAEVEIENSAGLLKPGMFASVSVVYRTEPSALLVPQSAVVTTETERWIFVAEEAAKPDDGGSAWIARRIPVSVIGASVTGKGLVAVEAVDGDLTPGMQVIVLGQEAVRDGGPVVAAGGTFGE